MSTAAREGALKRARGLFTEEAAAAAAGRDGAGYIDLLETELESTGWTQDLMLTRVVPAIYERWWRPALARVFKGVTGPGMAEEIRIARLLLGLGEGETVLDVACGPGNFSREFARAVGADGLVVGIDASETMLGRGVEEIHATGPDNLALVRGDATALPFRDDCFDGACCFAALHLFAEPFAALDEMTRVLKPGGRIALTDRADDLGPPPAHPAPAEAVDRARQRVEGVRVRRDHGRPGRTRLRRHPSAPRRHGPVRRRAPGGRLSVGGIRREGAEGARGPGNAFRVLR
jgi:SAM-dependent methyltransferase